MGLLAPGLGHVYLRVWARAIAWFFLAIAAIAVLLPESAYTAVESGGFEAAIEASASLPARVYLASLTVRVASAMDAGLLGLRTSVTNAPGADDGRSCPHCGRELDDDLDFCPWCTTRFETRE
jgi:hypothetical protein